MSAVADRWIEFNEEIAKIVILIAGEAALRDWLASKGTTYTSITLQLIIARYGVEVTGMLLASWINGESGVAAWQEYSQMVYDDMIIVPNPIPVLEQFVPLPGYPVYDIPYHYEKKYAPMVATTVKMMVKHIIGKIPIRHLNKNWRYL